MNRGGFPMQRQRRGVWMMPGAPRIVIRGSPRADRACIRLARSAEFGQTLLHSGL